MLNGLSAKYRHIATTLRHQRHVSSFWETRSMLVLKDQQLVQEESRSSSISHSNHTSSLTVLTADSLQQNTNRRGFCAGRSERNYRDGRGGGSHGGGQSYGGKQHQQMLFNNRLPTTAPPTAPSGWAFGWYQIPSQLGLLPNPPAQSTTSQQFTGLRQTSAQ